jgi:hypothetical protein
MTKDEALKLALDALFSSDDFLFYYHDCEPNNERELRRYEHARTQNKKATEAIRKILAKPKREWVGLTDEEKHDCYLRIDIWSRCVEMVEAKLKEKNCG